MSWIEKLSKTYDACFGAPQFETRPLLPLGHVEQQAHIEIVLDIDGRFVRADALSKELTVVPATEKSAGRTGTDPPPHPLCDKVRYCAADYGVDRFHSAYLKQLREWVSTMADPMLIAILRYVEDGHVVQDLIDSKILFRGPDGALLKRWDSVQPKPLIFKSLTAKEGLIDQGDAFIRWIVQIPGRSDSAVWKDLSVRDAWIRYEFSQALETDLCFVAGNMQPLATNHPKRIRHGADGAKIISTNDDKGYTFRGRFGSASQACGIGYETTQKAHNALRWLIERQGYIDPTGQVIVSWEISGKEVPKVIADTDDAFNDGESKDDETYTGDAGQAFAKRLSKLVQGYAAKLKDRDQVVVMGLDSATPGRMAITYYRELTGSEFLERIRRWHSRASWFQNYGKDRVGAPSPRDIAAAAYGKRVDDKLRKSTVERLLPCIVDARPIPHDLVESCVRRASNRNGIDNWEWEKCLGIACALYRGSCKEDEYKMALDKERATRDYLFGRLLAVADNIESSALKISGEQRDTNAAKLMHRFASRPASTWPTIETALGPYMSRLRSNRPDILKRNEILLDSIFALFQDGDFLDDSKLTGEFLLGYHNQRKDFYQKKESDATASPTEEDSEGEREEEE